MSSIYIPIAGYVIASVFINHILLYFLHTYIYGLKKNFFPEQLWWEIIPLLLISPIGILLFILYQQFYVQAIIYMMIPVITFSVIFRLYSKLNDVNNKMKTINHSGNMISRQLDVEHVISKSIDSIGQLVAYQGGILYLAEEPNQTLQVKQIFGPRISTEQKEKLKILQSLSEKAL